MTTAMRIGSLLRGVGLGDRRRARRVAGPRAHASGFRAPAVASLGLLLCLVPAMGAYRAPFRARQYVVAADHPEASRVGASVLEAGGSAADAAIATALALGVASPSSSGFGGGGFATVCTAAGACTFLDFRETAPAGLDAARLAAAPGTGADRPSAVGGLAVGVPGEPAGLLALSARFGRLPLARVVAPAVQLARSGSTVTQHLADAVRTEQSRLVRDPILSALLVPGGSPVAAGARLRRADLARTLERFGREGARYLHGAFASAVADAVQRAGGVLTADDLRAYRVAEREPLRGTFAGFEVVTAPPPSAGGLVVLQTLQWLDSFPRGSLAHGSSAYDHVLATAFRHAFDDRTRYVGDPGPDGTRLAASLLSRERFEARRRAFDPAHVTPVMQAEPARDAGTTHLCVIDAAGNVVSLTTTVNLAFGARFTVPGTGVVLNDEIDDFSLDAQGNFGLANAAPNRLAPGRRPVSSMAPTIVLRDGRPVGCVGGAGGPRIATATAQVVAQLLLFGADPERAVASPRIHHQGTPDRLLVERDVPEDVRTALTARGHSVVEADSPLAAVQALWVDPVTGDRWAASDPRKGGVPVGR